MSQKYTAKDYAKMSAERELSRYSEGQIKILAKKEKRIWYICTAVIGAVNIGMIAMFSWSILNELNFELVSSSIILLFGLTFNIFYYFKNKNNSDYFWAVKYLERKYKNNPNDFPDFFVLKDYKRESSSSKNIDEANNAPQKKASLLMDTPEKYIWCGEKILVESIRDNWERWHFVIIPILLFGEDLGLNKENLTKILKRL